jgi:hypothetical protein
MKLSLADLTIQAFGMIGVRPTAILQEHIETAKMSANLLLTEFSLHGINLWETVLETVPLAKGVSTYSVPADTVFYLDSWIVVNGMDRIINSISRTEYSSYPNKQQQGIPTVFWYQKLLAPQVTLWPVPDGQQATTLKYYRMKYIIDPLMANNGAVQIPATFSTAFVNGLAFWLSQTWAPSLSQGYKQLYDNAMTLALASDIETANTFISPQIGGYFRN